MQRAVAAVLGNPEAARYFDAAFVLEAANEITLAHEGELLRIDRLVALPGGNADLFSTGRVWWVLDFKLAAASRESPGFAALHREQMARYRAAVQAAQPGEEVRSALITGSGRVVPI